MWAEGPPASRNSSLQIGLSHVHAFVQRILQLRWQLAHFDPGAFPIFRTSDAR